MRQTCAEDFLNVFVVEGIIAFLAVLTGTDKTCAPEYAELVRDCTLSHVQLFREVIYAHFAVHQGGNYPYPCAVSENLENFGKIVENVVADLGFRNLTVTAVMRTGFAARFFIVFHLFHLHCSD